MKTICPKCELFLVEVLINNDLCLLPCSRCDKTYVYKFVGPLILNNDCQQGPELILDSDREGK
jgi:hypothetical protein